MTKHKNLVFIFSDQQRYDTMACYGNDWIKAPRLNELSEESFIFERAYVSQPVCSPSQGHDPDRPLSTYRRTDPELHPAA